MKNDINKILLRYLEGNASSEEIDILKEWSRESEENKKNLNDFLQLWHASGIIGHKKEVKIQKKWNEFQKKRIKSFYKKNQFNIYHYFKYAALIILLAGIGVVLKLFIDQPDEQVQQPVITEAHESGQILLSDGRTIYIDEEKAEIIHDKNGQINIISSSDSVQVKIPIENKSKRNPYNQIFIPKGHNYMMHLPDGTITWLNSDTRFQYFTALSQKERIVFLDGEAYFDVSKIPGKQFIVKTDNLKVNVTGTEFNVKAYRNENSVETTLVEGEVFISAHKNDRTVREKVKKGQQAVFNIQNNTIRISKVDTEKYTSWKEGYYKLEEAPFNEVITIISRYYGIEIIYDEQQFRENIISGKLERKNSAEQVIRNLQLLVPFQYEVIKDNKILIK